MQSSLLSGSRPSFAAEYRPSLLSPIIARFLALVPGSWVAAARACPVSPSYAAFAEATLPSLGWRTATGPFSVEQLTVRRATALQLGDRASRFDIRARAYVTEAQAASGVPRAAGLPDTDAPASMRRLLANLWRLKCGNDMKEVFWRLFHNGLPTAGRLHASEQRCGAGCSAVSPGRVHHFWECPVAQAVVAVLTAGLRRHCSHQPQPCAAPSIVATHVWLASPPSHCGVQAWAWQLVCLVAVAARNFLGFCFVPRTGSLLAIVLQRRRQ